MRKEWTTAETEYLLDRYCNQPVKKTAAVLGRSTASVKHKAQKLGLNIYVNEFIYARTLARCFNQDIRVVFRWIEKLGLPARKRRVANTLRYLIDVENFWKWAETHKEDINWSRYELMSLPPEPAWVREEKEATLHRKREPESQETKFFR